MTSSGFNHLIIGCTVGCTIYWKKVCERRKINKAMVKDKMYDLLANEIFYFRISTHRLLMPSTFPLYMFNPTHAATFSLWEIVLVSVKQSQMPRPSHNQDEENQCQSPLQPNACPSQLQEGQTPGFGLTWSLSGLSVRLLPTRRNSSCFESSGLFVNKPVIMYSPCQNKRQITRHSTSLFTCHH